MTDEYVYKISSRYLQKWLRYDIKLVKNSHFSRHFGTTVIFRILFLTDFDASKSVLWSFFRVFLRKSDLKTCIVALNYDFLPFFTW